MWFAFPHLGLMDGLHDSNETTLEGSWDQRDESMECSGTSTQALLVIKSWIAEYYDPLYYAPYITIHRRN